MSYALRTMGTVATLLPQMKRAVGRHTNGQTMIMVPDTNLAGTAGDDVTGTAKIHIYASTDSTRTNWGAIPFLTITPTQAASSSTKRFIGAMSMNTDNDIHIAYQGTDNSLRHISWNWNGTTYDAPVQQTIVAATGTTNRYRAIDLDTSGGTGGNPAVAVYEANASTGQGAWIRVYIRLNDGTTWRKAHEVQIQSTGFIKDLTEDVSVSWGADGIVTNVGRLALYYTRTSTTVDSGDTLKEIAFNVSTGTDGSATTTVTWSSNMNQNVASSGRRGWLFKHATLAGNPNWVFGGIVGGSLPFYMACKLHHNNAVFVINKTLNKPTAIINTHYPTLTFPTSQRPSYNNQSCSYSDQRLQFIFTGVGGVSTTNVVRGVVFRWPDSSENDTTVSIDSTARFIDGNYSIRDGVLGVYGGCNRINSGLFEYTNMAIYGDGGTNISALFDVYIRKARAIIEDVIPAPVMISPVLTTVSKDLPTFQAQSTGASLYPMVRGRLEIDVATDAGFTLNLHHYSEGEDGYRSYDSANGLTLSTKFITLAAAHGQELFTGTWYMRARIVDDMGGVSAYYSAQFDVSHPPAALPRIPAASQIIQFDSGNIVFSWDFSDTEPLDTQTAYQVVVTRLDTNATVVDTGKVSSSLSQAVILIPSSLIDFPLSYVIKLWDGDDNPGIFSSPTLFTVTLPPAVVITSPVNGATVTTGHPTIGWTFAASGGRTQTHFRVQIYDTDHSMFTADTGWQAGTAQSYTFPTQAVQVSTNYKVYVYVRDSAGLQGYSEGNLIGNSDFETGTTASWSVIAAATIAADTAHAYAGTYAMKITPSGASIVQSDAYVPVVAGQSYTASFQAFSVAGWTSVIVKISWYTSGLGGNGTSLTTTALGAGAWQAYSVTATAPGGTAFARVSVEMTGAPTGTDIIWVDNISLVHGITAFVTAWTPSVDGDISVTSVDPYKAIVAWTNANLDSDWVAWRVYRKYNKAANTDLDVDDTANTWELVYETTDVLSSYEFRDYLVPLNRSVRYAISQVVDRFGSSLESPLSTTALITVVGERFYFVPAVPIGTIASFEASNVTADQFAREVEQETLHVINRGRQVQIGDDLGYAGSYTIKLRNPATARSDREFIELLSKADNAKVYIRSPFGDVLYVSFGSVAFNRMAGVGLSDLGDLTVPYTEVFQDVPITRTA